MDTVSGFVRLTLLLTAEGGLLEPGVGFPSAV